VAARYTDWFPRFLLRSNKLQKNITLTIIIGILTSIIITHHIHAERPEDIVTPQLQ
jgi:hypothetical protein